jgi:stringent starvation protein B
VHQGKRKILEKLLEEGMVMVTLDARASGVDVPPHLQGNPQLRINLSHRFAFPLEIDDAGVGATLTFGDLRHDCRFPFASIYVLVSHTSGKPLFFPEDLPEEFAELAAELEQRAAEPEPEPDPEPVGRKVRHLRVVK